MLALPQDLARVVPGIDVDSPNLSLDIETAEQLIATHLGSSTLDERTVTEVKFPVRDRAVLEVEDGPIFEIVGVWVGGVLIDPDVLTFSHWLFATTDGTFTRGSEVEVEYNAGWTVGTVPAQIRTAILHTAASLRNESGKRGTTQERFGDYSVAYANPDQMIPAAALALLNPFKKPMAF